MTEVTEHLQTHCVRFEPIAHQQAYTSIDEARALGIGASEVLKTVAMRVAGGYALMAIPVHHPVGPCHIADRRKLGLNWDRGRDLNVMQLRPMAGRGRTWPCRRLQSLVLYLSQSWRSP
jgi:hypothetical protein